MKASIEIQSGILNTLGQPEIKKYFNDNGEPYVDVAQVMSQIPENRRHQGLTVNVAGVEYWWATNVLTNEPVIKTAGGGGTGVSVTNATINGSGHLIITLSDNTIIDAGVAVGPQGATGSTGATGATGNGIASTSYNASTGVLTITYTSGGTYSTGDLRGAAGATGAAGSKWYNGTGAPSAGTGVSGDYYLNTANGDVYVKTTSWAVLTNIKGATGATGATGSAGANGATWLSGSSAPTTQGVNGDFYLNTTTYDVSIKTAGTWNVVVNIKGPIGNTGATGSTGATGAQGPQGIQGIQGPEGPAGPSTPQVINDNSITNAKLAQVATGTIKGRKTASTGNVEDLTAAEVVAMLGLKKEMLISKSTFNGIALEPGIYKNGATAKQITGYRLMSNATDFQITIGGTSYTKDSVFPITLAANAELLINDVTIANTYNIGNVILIIE